jgi:VanZ family protein
MWQLIANAVAQIIGAVIGVWIYFKFFDRPRF